MNDSWVLSELPKTNEVNEEILTELNALTNDSDEMAAVQPNGDDESDQGCTQYIVHFKFFFITNVLIASKL